LLHRLGLWETWKFIEVDGGRYHCWEIQRKWSQRPVRTRNIRPPVPRTRKFFHAAIPYAATIATAATTQNFKISCYWGETGHFTGRLHADWL
jgi:hypothetical protein